MTFEKVVGEESSVDVILRGCTKCVCGCGVCNSQSKPSESNKNDGARLDRDHYNGSHHS